MTIESRLKGLRKAIDRNLDKYLPAGGKKDILSRAMRHSVFSGGKRIRPIFTIESCVACGGGASRAMPTACAIEFAHTYSLIHDDLPSMDDDDYRRGKPACHKAFGEANAILAGDGLLTLAFNILSKEPDPKKGAAAIRELSEAIGHRGMVAGQALDLETKGKRKNAEEAREINLLKTAKLFEASAKMGGIAAGAPRREIDALASFGLLTGMAFQAIDDIMDRERPASGAVMAETLEECVSLTEKAKGYLKAFGRPARALMETADLILYRTE